MGKGRLCALPGSDVLAVVRGKFRALSAVLLEFPVSVVERADLTCLEPTGDAVEMECVLE